MSPDPPRSNENPYNHLIDACDDNAPSIQECYELHRRERNALQRSKILDDGFTAVDIDPILYKMVNSSQYPQFRDPRHCLVFWARPPKAICQLIEKVQAELQQTVPSWSDKFALERLLMGIDLWLMPPENLHMTTLEITHSLTEPEIEARLTTLSSKLEEITDFTYSHRARLVRPMLSYDASAIALSFVPLSEQVKAGQERPYTYHHLRRDLWNLCSSTGVTVESRYVVPSAHLTIGRFVSQKDFFSAAHGSNELDKVKVGKWIASMDDINTWLRESYWADHPKIIPQGGEWIVGQEKGLDCSKGTLWYGNGIRVHLGKGF